MLKEIRIEKKLTQSEAAAILGISLRSYKSYENDADRRDTKKYARFEEQLSRVNPLDEEHGILELDDIVEICTDVFNKYNVSFCFLFGSYAKNCASEKSDVDLLISTDVKGLKFFGLVEELRERLHKKVDLLDVVQLKDNFELMQEILKEGIKIYG